MSWRPVTVAAAAATTPVSVTEARAQCRASSGADEDTLLTRLINGATTHVEQLTGTKLITQTVTMKCSSFCDFAKLPTGPIQSITEIKYLDEDGAEQTLADTVYEAQLDGLVPQIRLKVDQSWPNIRHVSDAIRVTAVAGYGAATAVPQPLVHAILLLVGQWYDYRGPVDEMNVNHLPNSVKALLAPYRRF